MSFNALRAVAALVDTDPPDLSPIDRAVLWVLADAADENGAVKLGSTRLGRRVGLIPGNVRRHRGHLVAAGYLDRCEGGSPGRTSSYRIPLALSTTRITMSRVEKPNPRRGDATPDSPRVAPRLMTTRDSSSFPVSNPAPDPVDDATDPAFTDAETARAWRAAGAWARR